MLQLAPTTDDQIAVVTVLHNSADVIEGMLASVPRDAEVIVVDNASSDDGLARARAARSDVVAIVSDTNLGFGGGCNVGWRATSRPYLAFVNPDVRLREDTLRLLLAGALERPHAMVGPALLDNTGALRPCKRRPSALLDFVGLLPSAARWAPAGWDGKLAREDYVHAGGGTVDALEGACFLISRADLEAIGGFDEDLFLYYEEDSLALRLREVGGAAIYAPEAVAEHVGGTSMRRVADMATRQRHRSRVIFYRKRDGDLRGQLTALMLLLAVLLSLPISVLNLILGRRRLTTFDHQWQVARGLVAGMGARPTHTPGYRVSRG